MSRGHKASDTDWERPLGLGLGLVTSHQAAKMTACLQRRGPLEATSLSILPHPVSSGPALIWLLSWAVAGRGPLHGKQEGLLCSTTKQPGVMALDLLSLQNIKHSVGAHTGYTNSVPPFSKLGQVLTSASASSASKSFVPRKALPCGMCMENAC